MKLHPDLREFIELLNSVNVEYVIVGGHAVAFHGYPRYTGDIDFFVGPTEENAARVRDVLVQFGLAREAMERVDFTADRAVFQIGKPPNRIDILSSISGVSFDEVYAARVAAELGGLPVAFIGRAELLTNKRASGRKKDELDVEQLEN